jgi:hypothetical protein
MYIYVHVFLYTCIYMFTCMFIYAYTICIMYKFFLFYFQAALVEFAEQPSKQGSAVSGWILLDYGSIIVHVMTPQMRNFYKLEKRWKEAEVCICLFTQLYMLNVIHMYMLIYTSIHVE